MMRRCLAAFGLGMIAICAVGFGNTETRFLVTGGEATVGAERDVVMSLVQAPAGFRAMEGVLTLKGVAGQLGEVKSSFELEVLERARRRLRFRLVDLENQLEPGAQDVVLLHIGVIPEETGELAVELAVPFLVTDREGGSPVVTEGQPLRVIAPAEENEPPLAQDDIVETQAGTTVIVDVLQNDVDPDGAIDPTTLTIVDLPLHGSVELVGDGQVAYTPDPGFTGFDVFTYSVSDDTGAVSNLAKVQVTTEALPTHGPASVSLLAMGGQWVYGQSGWLTLAFDHGGRGLRRLEFKLVVTNPDLLSLADVEWGGLHPGAWALMRDVPGRWTMWVADLFDQVRPESGVIQARIQLVFCTVGSTRLQLTEIRGIDDHGEAFSLPDTSVGISCALDPLVPEGGPPQDLDGDGRFEDLNGDGRLTLYDALVLAFNFDRPPLEEVPDVVDFDGDGALTFADAQALAKLVGR